MEYIFTTQSYWLEMSVPQRVVNAKYVEYFGNESIEITSRDDAVKYLLEITEKIQKVDCKMKLDT